MNIRRAKSRDAKRINDLLYQVAKIHADGRPDIFKTATKKYSDDELIEIVRQVKKQREEGKYINDSVFKEIVKNTKK